MRKTSLIAPLMTLALAGVPAASVAATTPLPDPIAHAAKDPIAHAAHGQDLTAPQRATVPVPALRKICAAESHKHVKGEKGTPFSQCVHALKTLEKGTATSPKAACKAESRTHVKGEKGTPFSRCVAAARKLKRAQHTASHAAAPTGPR